MPFLEFLALVLFSLSDESLFYGSVICDCGRDFVNFRNSIGFLSAKVVHKIFLAEVAIYFVVVAIYRTLVISWQMFFIDLRFVELSIL